MARFNPLPFSPLYAFTALRPMTIAGVAYQIGDAIDKDSIAPIRLRQLYDARKIAPHAPDFLFNGPAPEQANDGGQGGELEPVDHAPAPLAPDPDNPEPDAAVADAIVAKPAPRARRRISA